MTRMLMFALLAGCASLPENGRVYECEATVWCDGKSYEVTPAKACVDGKEEALALFQERLDELLEGARCTTLEFDIRCLSTGEHCFASADQGDM